MEKERRLMRWILPCLLLSAAGTACAGPGPYGAPGFFSGCVSVGLGITAFVVWARGSFPELAARADRTVSANSSARTFWIGLANVAVLAAVFVAVAKAGEVAGKAVVPVLVAYLLGAGALLLRGAVAVWPSYGHLLLGPDSTATDLQASLMGGALLTAFLFFFPFGTLFFAYAVARAVGVSVLLMVKEG